MTSFEDLFADRTPALTAWRNLPEEESQAVLRRFAEKFQYGTPEFQAMYRRAISSQPTENDAIVLMLVHENIS